jgi:hypothetical protein
MSKESISLPADPKKRVSLLTTALGTAIETLATLLPRAGREAVQVARERLDAAEAATIRVALERCQWRVQPAADLLGYPRTSALEKLIQTGRRHEAIGLEIKHQRQETGYSRGRPPATQPETSEVLPVGQNVTPRRRRNTP